MNLVKFISNYWLESITIALMIQTYLKINQVWIRKHNKVVSESISLFNYLIILLIAPFFLVQYSMVNYHLGLLVFVGIFTLSASILFFIGTGLWVHENWKLGFLHKIIRAFRIENNEKFYLLGYFTQRKNVDELLKIFQQVSEIDHEISAEEVELINKFAREWTLELPTTQPGKVKNPATLWDLRNSIESYLDKKPSFKQVSHLADMLSLIIRADGKITVEEDLILAELEGFINDYIQKNPDLKPGYAILLVPQSAQQNRNIQALFPNIRIQNYCGGKAYAVAECYTKAYAEEICKRNFMNSFSVAVKIEEE